MERAEATGATGRSVQHARANELEDALRGAETLSELEMMSVNACGTVPSGACLLVCGPFSFSLGWEDDARH